MITLEKEVATHSNILFFFSFIFIGWRLITSQHFSGFCHTLTLISPLQYSCLGNPKDRRAWQATFHGVLKELDTT